VRAWQKIGLKECKRGRKKAQTGKKDWVLNLQNGNLEMNLWRLQLGQRSPDGDFHRVRWKSSGEGYSSVVLGWKFH
jgi:hypothetical protein